MSAIVYRVYIGVTRHESYFAPTLAEAERVAARWGEDGEGVKWDVVIERLSTPHATSAVVAQMLNGREWAEARTEVARYRAGKKVDPA